MTPQQAATAPPDQLRDWCAEDDGWNKPGTPIPLTKDWKLSTAATQAFVYGHWWKAFGECTMRLYDHPHPPTIDGAAKAMPEGWEWWKVTAEWAAQAANTPMIRIPDTGDEMADRYLLAVLCRIAAKEAKG